MGLVCNSILTVTLGCEFEGEPCELTKLNCVTVYNEEAATSNEPPYFGWFIQADFFYSIYCTLSVSDNSIVDINVYPNPTSGYLNISVTEDLELKEVVVYNTLGQKVSQTKGTAQINVSHIPSGIYYLSISTDQRTVTKTMVRR